MVRSILIALTLVLIQGCSSRAKTQLVKPTNVSQTEAGNAKAPETVDPDETKQRKIYYADLQIVIETSTEGVCADSLRQTWNFQEPLKVKLLEPAEGTTDPIRLERSFGKKSVEYYALNVQAKMMGFDAGDASFSALDGVVPEGAPYQMRIRRRPGNFIDLFYLGQTFRMQLTQTPVYSFSMHEERTAACSVIHNLNIFSDRAGYYEAD